MENNFPLEIIDSLCEWFKIDITQEIRNNFIYSRRFNNVHNFNSLKVLDSFTSEEKSIILSNKMRKALSYNILNSQMEESIINEFNTKYMNEVYKSVDYFHSIYKKYNKSEIKSTICDVFALKVISKYPEIKQVFQDKSTVFYELNIDSFVVITKIFIGRSSCEYFHVINTKLNNLAYLSLSFPGWVGFAGGWSFLNQEDIKEAANDISYHSLRFIQILKSIIEKDSQVHAFEYVTGSGGNIEGNSRILKNDLNQGGFKAYPNSASHHLIPTSVIVKHPIAEIAERNGYDQNSGKNGVQLPSNRELSKRTGIPLHTRQNAMYDLEARKALDSVYNSYLNGNIPEKDVPDEIYKEAAKIRKKILSKQLKLTVTDPTKNC